MAAPEVPDWLRAMAIIGSDSGGDYHVVVVDDDGNLVAAMKGNDAGTLRTVKVDSDGQIYVLIKGPNGEDIAIDASGFISAILKGNDDGTLRTLVVDDDGNLVSVIKGDDAGTLRTIAVDDTGQLYVLIKGSSGESVAVDANGYLSAILKGVDGSTLRTLAVDSSGNLITLIKGAYDSTLKTLATDADGRLLIVPYEAADVWGNTVGVGSGEVVAALTPCKRYDRRGNIVFWDTFAEGLVAWYTQASAGGGAVVLSSARSRDGAYSAKLTAAGTYSQLARMLKGMPRIVGGRLGFEAAFCWEDDIDFLFVGIYWNTGSTTYAAVLKWNAVDTSLEYMKSDGTYTDLDAAKPLYVDIRYWHILKVVVDTDTGKYVRAFCDDEEYDMSNIACYSAVNASNPACWADIWVDGFDAESVDVWVDSAIFTQNEPA